MRTMSANEAKKHFGQLLDTARREPVSIEKHGRKVAVLLSSEDYDDFERMQRDQLKSEIKLGLDQLERGQFTETDEAGLTSIAQGIKAAARKGHAL
jgi:prevent-host-death family protein